MRIDNVTINVHTPAAGAVLEALLGKAASGSADVHTGELSTPPKIGEVWLDQGGIYAGISSEGGDHHLILCAAEPRTKLAWQAARDWAKGLEIEGFNDFSLPTRFESALLYANLRDRFDQSTWYWTDTQYSVGCAYYQFFSYGGQCRNGKSYEAKVRAVRRLPL